MYIFSWFFTFRQKVCKNEQKSKTSIKNALFCHGSNKQATSNNKTKKNVEKTYKNLSKTRKNHEFSKNISFRKPRIPLVRAKIFRIISNILACFLRFFQFFINSNEKWFFVSTQKKQRKIFKKLTKMFPKLGKIENSRKTLLFENLEFL